MECREATTRLDAYLDGELDGERTAELEAHAVACDSCAALIDERRHLRGVLGRAEYRGAPAALRASVLRELGAPGGSAGRKRAPAWAWLSLAASVALGGATIWLAAQRLTATNAEGVALREAVSSHIRSLMASHLADIAVSDQHAVKPWFAGKLDFSPPVVDYGAEGFPLSGGRLDYIGGRPVAAVIYNRRAHVINLFVCPDASGVASPPRASEDRGYHSVSWSDGSMSFTAVSDLNSDELAEFAQLVRGVR